MKALFAISALLISTTAFAYSASEGKIHAIQNNEAYHDIAIQGDAAKAIYQDLRVEEVPNNNDNAPGFTKAGQDITCDVIGSVNYYCYIALNRKTGAIQK